MTVNDGITDVAERADLNQLRSSNISCYKLQEGPNGYVRLCVNVYTLNPQCLAKLYARDHAAAAVVPSAVVPSWEW